MTILELFQPRFTAEVAGRRMESNSIADLIRQGASTELDHDALNIFIRLGSFIGADTPFKAIRFKCPPSIESLNLRPVDLPREQILDAYNDLFRQAMSRCMQAAEGRRVRMGLSAGRDSRHIFLELWRQKALPDLCWTLDFPGESDAVDIARQLTSRAGVPHTAVTVPHRDFLAREIRKNQATSFSSIQHSGMVPALGVIEPDDVLYDGIGGDVLSAGLFLTEERVKLVESGRIDEFIETIISKGSWSILRDAALFPRRTALERVSAEFRRHLSAPDPVSSFYCWTRTRRDIGASAFALIRPQGQTVLAPYLDEDLFRFLSGLTARMTVDHRLHTDAITKAYTEFVDIPYGSKNYVPWSVHRSEALAAMKYIALRRTPLLMKTRFAAALFRTTISRSRGEDAFWLSRLAIYFTGLSNPHGLVS